ncbi:MAG: tRNA (adenosine(37)-N6)-threonylcarbamoyltransferase complex transferase subunit TsaD [Candidatus Saccharimonadales bacterium]
MKILGIESSCDETAAAVVEEVNNKPELLSNVLVSQIDIHREFGGVVPEIAARNHIEVILPVIEKALKEAQTNWKGIDAIAVTNGPGLPGSLLIGTLTARTLALLKNKPLYGVNHVEGHAYANWLLAKAPLFPVLALIVSGGHTQLVLFRDHFTYKLLGQTIDDAAGEAFDKVAKLLGLDYPGGPAIAKAAESGDASAFDFPKPQTPNIFDFSYSGLKTAVLRHLQDLIGKDYSFPSFEIAQHLTKNQVYDTAAGFQRTAVEILVDKTETAFRQYSPKSVIIAGGVAANRELRTQLQNRLPIEITYAPPLLCTDNAAMIASLGYYTAKNKQPTDPFTLETNPGLAM